MNTRPHILLLAGSSEAQRMAEALAARGLTYAAWLSEAPRGAAPFAPVPQLRRFADGAAMQGAMVQGGFDAVIDAGHGFDAQTTAQACAAAGALGLPVLRLAREAWDLPPQERARDVRAANAMLLPAARVFCATGWDSLPDYAGFVGAVLLLRQTRRHARAALYSFVELVFGDPPFTAASEQALLRSLNVDTLVCRNIGGAASLPKIDAARALGVRVIAVDRPALPEGLRVVAQVDAVLDWLDAL